MNGKAEEWFLTALQISDSFFPVGAYAVTYGMETFVQQGFMGRNGEPTLTELLEAYLRFQIGPLDLVAMMNSYRISGEGSIKELVKIDRMLYAMKLVEESRETSTGMRRNMIKAISMITSNSLLEDFLRAVEEGETPGNYAVAYGLAAYLLHIPLVPAAQSMLYSFTAGMLGASIRLGVTDHLRAQRILHKMKGVIIEVVEENLERRVEEMDAFSPMIDIAGLIHKRLETRMFIS